MMGKEVANCSCIAMKDRLGQDLVVNFSTKVHRCVTPFLILASLRNRTAGGLSARLFKSRLALIPD